MKKKTNSKYVPAEFESQWRSTWADEKLYWVDNPIHRGKPKYYCLDMFPYPSGSGLHVGHWRGYVLSDVWSRYQMLHGYNVLHPMGWDNFGLPAELDAIKKGIHPKISTRRNIDNMKRQLKELGCAYDWEREIDTTDPEYYKWTQWIFLQMFKKGLAYRKNQPVNWCNTCCAVLANEEVEGGKCERCNGSDIKKKDTLQWMLRITHYADRLLRDLDELNWPEKVKEMQRNWIGRSEGARVTFQISAESEKIPVEVFTTRPDTLFGATFVVFAPEHPLVKSLTTADRKAAVEQYVKNAQALSNVERQKADKDRSGVFTGSYAVNPVNGAQIPVWIADYVLMDYGTGVIMAVPAHDQRDFAFAKKHKLPIIEVIHSEDAIRDHNNDLAEAYTGDGKLVNSDYINSLDVESAKHKIVRELSKRNTGQAETNYRLRDWIFARQRYWGEPIPVIHCDHCGIVPVPERELPVELPDISSYEATSDGSSPLAHIDEWVNVPCPKCSKSAKRETDTMPQWAGSSWYFLRFTCPHHEPHIVSDEINGWLPVAMYVGGVEHAVLHLLYARFWTKFLFDQGVVPFEEPFVSLFNQGMITRRAHRCDSCNRWIHDDELPRDSATDQDDYHCPTCRSQLQRTLEKMSKSKGNGVNPDDLVEKFGTDSLRIYELFAGDPCLDSEWNDEGIKGCHTFLRRAWNFVVNCDLKPQPTKKASELTNVLIHQVEKRTRAFKLNTAISAFMEFINGASRLGDDFSRELIEHFLITLAPFAPHFSEELWRNHLGNERSIFLARFPECDETLLKKDAINMAIQVNGRVRAVVTIKTDASTDEIKDLVFELNTVRPHIAGREIKKIIHVPNRIFNIVAK